MLSGIFVLLMLASASCGGAEPDDAVKTVAPVGTQASGTTPTNIVPTEQTEAIDIGTVAPVATPALDPTNIAVAPADHIQLSGNGIWILESLDGDPIVEDSFVQVEIGENEADGYDGCNWFGGSSEDGAPVADKSGLFSFPLSARTARLCEEPSGVMEQSDAFFSALGKGETYRVAGERLEIIDNVGDVRLVFVKHVPLEGSVVDLSETAWRLVEDDVHAPGGSKAATMAFLDDRLVIGNTACRPYLATYNRSDGRVHFPSQSMLERSIWQSCSDKGRRLEGEFTDFMGSTEYAVQEAPGLMRLRMRNSEGITLTFEPLPQIVDDVADADWVLLAITELRQLEVGMWHNRIQKAVTGADLTISFHADGISGSTGCNSYEAEARISEGSVKLDSETFFYTELGCQDLEGVMEQEERYLDVLPNVTRYGVYGDHLVLQTNDDVFLLFRTE
ncbi:MAG: META domain-containing protein [Chloroflexi bacterium]|nr:META domain-containing protein [Chloroflexota bacterium]